MGKEEYLRSTEEESNWRSIKGQFSVSDEFPHIVEDPEICHGEPTIKGTRIVVSAVIDYIKEGLSAETIVALLPELTKQDIAEVIRYANSNESWNHDTR